VRGPLSLGRPGPGAGQGGAAFLVPSRPGRGRPGRGGTRGIRPGQPLVRRARAGARRLADRGATHRLRRRRPGERRPVMRRRPARLPVLLLLATVAGCGPGSESGESDASGGPVSREQSVELVDASGRTVTLPRAASRIVSLVPSATLTLHALGAADRLVGRTDYDTESWAADLPSVGGGLDPDLETIVALRPDLVVRFAGEQDPRTPARLDDLGIPHVAVRPDRVDDVYRTVEILGRGRPIVLRSEEHASELQSRENLVCRLLLENKKNNVSKEI